MADESKISESVTTLSEELNGLINEVDSALESTEEARQIATSEKVDAFVARYQATLAPLPPDEKRKAELRLERRMIDVRRAAAKLPRRASGQRVALAHDAGSVPFVLQRAPGRSMHLQRAGSHTTLSVGSDVESWCGKCKDMREHRIVAMVGGEPKQVVCATCHSRHNYRTEPPARAQKATPAEGEVEYQAMSAPSRLSDREGDRQRDAKRALQRELADAPEPRQFDPKARYKAGEIIVHPEHGRGKIENVLRSSLLVRFVDGLRPVDLF